MYFVYTAVKSLCGFLYASPTRRYVREKETFIGSLCETGLFNLKTIKLYHRTFDSIIYNII